ncbi:DUF1206 domain-containing protein [Rathayibacter sp. YIM 133350]|uniref:DUF1206 domain-containing protein n=1 Tax=Rathayibacter sp. YIM 133350 TaxID=3131992 RepID=UPI00307EF657
MTDTAKKVARTAKNSRAMQVLARAGFVASGVLHVIIGFIAIAVASGGGGGQEADQSGALAQLAQMPGGLFLLWAAAVGLAALGIWLILSAFLDRACETKRKRSVHIVQNIGKAIAYLAVAFTASVFAIGGTTSSAQSTSQLGATLLASPGGVFLVGLIGLVLLGIGGYMVYKGVSRRFERDIRMPASSAGHAVRVLGIVGYVARGVAFGAVGVLFLVAAITNDPSKTTGLDGALKSLVTLPLGVLVLLVIGAGWILYGIYAFFRARLARL